MKTGNKVQVKVLSKDRHCFRDCTIGKIYSSTYLEVDHYAPDGIKAERNSLYFTDDTGDLVTFHIDNMKNTFELLK